MCSPSLLPHWHPSRSPSVGGAALITALLAAGATGCAPSRDCSMVLWWVGEAEQVSVVGDWNGWSDAVDILEPYGEQDGQPAWRIQLHLDPGDWAYQLEVDGVRHNDPFQPLLSWDPLERSETSLLRIADCSEPAIELVQANATASGTVSIEASFHRAAGSARLDPDSVRAHTSSGLAIGGTAWPRSGRIELTADGLPEGKHSVHIRASDHDGREVQLQVPLWVEEQPFSWDDAVIYQLITDRFAGPDGQLPEHAPEDIGGRMGGDIAGLTDVVESGYFEHLGVNVLWITPVYENPDGSYIGIDATNYYSGYHGYCPVEPHGIEERLGDWGEGYYTPAEDRLEELIEKAHERSIRVLFDLVLNHVHEDHSYVSEHPDWFGGGCICGEENCDWDEHAIDCWFIDYLPDLDYTNHDLAMRVLDDTMTLIRDYDVDAVRVDAAKHMNHLSMRTLRMRLQDEVQQGGGAEIYTVGESFTSDRGVIMDYVADYELHGQFDFPLYYSIRSTFVDGGSFADLESAVAAGESAYGDAIMSPFLGNHDIERFASDFTGAGGDCWSGWTEDPMADGGSEVTQWDLINHQSMAFAFTLTQPGAPLIYYGDEIGLHGWGDPDNRRMMSFDPYLSANQTELRDRVAAIGQARQQHAALRRGERVQLWVDGDFLAYARDNGSGDVAIVAMNKSDGSRAESVSVSSLGLSDGQDLSDVFSGSSFEVSGGQVYIGLDSMQYVILVP